MFREKLDSKFDLESLERTKQQLLDIQMWSTIQQVDNDTRELYDMIDGLCRVAHMYNMIITQEVRDKNIVTSDPQDYIDSKISYPYHIYKKRSDTKEVLD